MKLQNLLLTLFAAGALFAGCKEKEPEPELPNLNVGQTELAFEQGGGSGSITVTSNRPWTISTDADWLAFNPTNGSAQSGPVTVSVTALPNTSTDRTATFKVKTDFDFRTVNVPQKGSKGEDPNVTPSGSGTASDPYNVAAALAKATSLQALNSSSDELTSAIKKSMNEVKLMISKGEYPFDDLSIREIYEKFLNENKPFTPFKQNRDL